MPRRDTISTDRPGTAAAIASSMPTLRTAIDDAIATEMARDPTVFMLGFEVSVRTGLAERFGAARVRDTPVAELATLGLAVGAARRGLRPIVDLMGSSFFFLAMDQLANHAAVTRYMFSGAMPMSLVLRGVTGVGEVAAAAHHGRMAHPMLFAVPGLKLVMPSDSVSGHALAVDAIRDPDPVVLLEHVRLFRRAEPLPAPREPVRLGRAAVRTTGDDVTVVAIGPAVAAAIAAAREVAQAGVSVEVIDLGTLHPLDLPTIERSVVRTGRLVVVDEAPETSSIANYIAAELAQRRWGRLAAPIRRLTMPDSNVPFSAAGAFESVIPGVKDIERAIVELNTCGT